MEVKIYPIEELIVNENNPRLIKDNKFEKLVKSIKEFPDMLKLRPIVVDTQMKILGGNMRYNAAKEVGLKELPVAIFTEELYQRANDQLQAIGQPSKSYQDFCNEFLIKDNVGFGEWDWERLANEWDNEQLIEWGLDLPDFNHIDYSQKNEEIDIDSLDETMTIKLNFTQTEYWIVKQQLSKLAGTPEQAIWKLLGNE